MLDRKLFRFGTATFGGFTTGRIMTPHDAAAFFETSNALGIYEFDGADLYEANMNIALAQMLTPDLPWDSFAHYQKVGRSHTPIIAGVDIPGMASDQPEGSWNKPARYRRIAERWAMSYEAIMDTVGKTLEILNDNVRGFSLHDPADFLAYRGVKVTAKSSVLGEAIVQMLGDAVAALKDLKKGGFEIGIGTKEVPVTLALITKYPKLWDYVMITKYNLMDHAEALEKLFPVCRKHEIKIVIAGIYYGGILASDPRLNPAGLANYQKADPAQIEKASQLWQLALSCGMQSLQPAAAQFVAANDDIHRIVLGARDQNELVQNVSNFNRVVPNTFWEGMRKLGYLTEGAAIPNSK